MKSLYFKIIILLVLMLLILPDLSSGQVNRFKELKIFESDTLFTFELVCSKKPFYSYFTYEDPAQEVPFKLIVDLKNTRIELKKKKYEINRGPLYRVRTSQWLLKPAVVRIVFDLIDKINFDIKYTQNGLAVVLSGFKKAERKILAVKPSPEKKEIKQQLKEKFIRVMNYKNTSLVTVLRAFSELHNLNIILAKDVSPQDNITVNLRNVPVEGALDAILKANDYNYVKKGNICLIKGKDTRIIGDMVTEIIKLNYIDAGDISKNLESLKSDNGSIETFVRSPIGQLGLSVPTGGGGAGGAGGGMQSALSGLVGAGQAQAGGAAVAGGGPGGGPGGAAAPTGRSDILIITDCPEIVQKMKALVKELDVPVPQINIEVRLIETRLDEKNKWGINWTAIMEAVGVGGYPTGLGMGRGMEGVGGAAAGGVAGGGAAGAGGMQVPGLPLKINNFRFGTLAFNQFKIVLELLEQQGNTKLLNQPSITTLDNQQADIAVGTLIPIEVTQVGMGGLGGFGGAAGGAAAGGMGGAGAMGGAITTIQHQSVAISLSVIPHVNEGKYITLWVQPKVQEISGFTGKNNDLPITTTRTATTQVQVKDGDVVVIGGLIKEDKIKTVKKVKFLGDIPLIGNLFKSSNVDTRRSELVIFISPKISPVLSKKSE
ncbi:hypothetical protein DRQ09_02090 [candidate division KSB1 bacterium]|nr:MAG: hypothetical protein DRQ09_02090 [candidate division KSB1 bacterium]